MATAAPEKLTLYTNHGCPWAHRAHIALNELKVPFEEVIIPLDRPRDPWYLEINPRGLVPSLSVDGEILTESAVVAQFLVDAYPSHLVPASNEPGAALKRARINFFVDTFFTKFQSILIKSFSAKTDEEADKVAQDSVAAIVKEIEPLLADAGPYFGGSDKLTLAEVLTGSFVVRLLVLIEAGAVYSASLGPSLQSQAPKFWKWAQTVSSNPNVGDLLDKNRHIEFSKGRLEKARAEA